MDIYPSFFMNKFKGILVSCLNRYVKKCIILSKGESFKERFAINLLKSIAKNVEFIDERTFPPGD